MTHEKFKLMVAVCHNLEVNWARLLVAGMKMEAKKVKATFDDNGHLELNVQRKA